MRMARKLAVLLTVFVLGGATLAAGTAVSVPGFNASDLLKAWPATERFHENVFVRIVSYPSAVHGRVIAKREIAQGQLGMKLWGMPGPARAVYSQMLKERGIAAVMVAGCVVSLPDGAEWNAYNDVMTTEIERRYGDTFFETIAREAQAEFDRQNAS
jgi:hypothetical protein